MKYKIQKGLYWLQNHGWYDCKDKIFDNILDAQIEKMVLEKKENKNPILEYRIIECE